MAPRAVTPDVQDDRARTSRANAAGRGRALLAVITLAVGIGSCQLPQPPIPRLSAWVVGGVTAIAAPTGSTHTRGDRT